MQRYAQEKYELRLPYLKDLKEEVEIAMEGCSFEEQVLMKFFMVQCPLGMPENIILTYSWDLLGILLWFMIRWNGAGRFRKISFYIIYYITGLYGEY